MQILTWRTVGDSDVKYIHISHHDILKHVMWFKNLSIANPYRLSKRKRKGVARLLSVQVEKVIGQRIVYREGIDLTSKQLFIPFPFT